MRSTFNQRFRILLYWYIIIKCIHQTNQQDILGQKVIGQKTQKLADTSDTKSILEAVSVTKVCTDCTIVSSADYDKSRSRKTSSEKTDHNYEWSSSSSSEEISQNSHQRHQYHHQMHQSQHHHKHNFHSSQLVNKQKLPESDEDTVNHVDNDLLKVDSNDASRNHLTLLSSSSTIPSQLPSPPSSSTLNSSSHFTFAIAETATITPTDETDEINSKSKELSENAATAKVARAGSVSEIRPQSDNSLRETDYNDDDDDDDDDDDGGGGSNLKDDNISTEYTGVSHKSFAPVTTDVGRNNIYYSIFHKFSLANIFGGSGGDGPRTTNSYSGKDISDISNNVKSHNGGDGNHIINGMISDADNNHSKEVISNESNIRRTKRIKRDSSSDILAASNNKFIPSSSSSSTTSSTSSLSNSSSSAKHKEDITSSSSDISSKSDIRYNKTISSSSSTSSASLSSSSQLDLSKISNQQQDQLTTHSSNSIPTRMMDDGVNLTLNAFIDKTTLNERNSKLMSSNEPIVIIDDDGEQFESGLNVATNMIHRSHRTSSGIGSSGSSSSNSNSDEDYMHGDDPRVLPSGPIIRGPYYDNDQQHITSEGIDEDGMSVVYAEQHSEIKLTCDVNSDVTTSVWLKNGQIVHTLDRNSRSVPDYRFIKEPFGGLTITNVMLEDDGEWQCEAENSRGLVKNARPIKLVVLDRPKPPYLLIDSRRLDAGNIFVPVKENSELSLACISEGGNPKPTLTWEVLLSPGVDRHAQKVAAEVLELEEIKNEKDKEPYKINSGAKSEARLPAVYRAHHNARILCVMEHPTLKMRQNASLLLDVQYTPSFAISRTPGFGYPLREGIEVSLKCDVDSNPPSTPRWQKDDGDTPVPQTGDGFLNFTSIRREHSGWYKCTSRHLNFQYSSIGYYLSVRYDSVDVTSEPDDQEVSVAASHNPNKGQLEVQLGGAVTLQCPQGSLGCWSHLDPVTARLRGLGVGLSTPTGQFSLKDVVYQDAGTYKCIGQSPNNKKKLEVLQTVGVLVKGPPTVTARNSTPVAYPGSPLHLTVEFCANPPAYAARWLHGDRVYTPGNQYGSTVLAYGVSDLPTPFCKEARLTYVSMHERVPRTFYFIVSSPGGVAEAIFKVNFTLRYRTMSNSIDDEEEELSEPEEIHFPVFGNSISVHHHHHYHHRNYLIFNRNLLLSILLSLLFSKLLLLQICTINVFS